MGYGVSSTGVAVLPDNGDRQSSFNLEANEMRGHPTITQPAPKKGRQPGPQSSKGVPHYTLEQVFGSVPTPPHLRGKDIEEMIREAKEERAERMTQPY